MGKAYYAKSMLVARATGIPYRQNDIMISASSGRVLLRSNVVSDYHLNEEWYMQLTNHDGKMGAEIRWDEMGRLGEHLRFVDGQTNMLFYDRQLARSWCLAAHENGQLRLRITKADRSQRGLIVLEFEKVDDMCAMYNDEWGTRKKRPRLPKGTGNASTPGAGNASTPGVEELNDNDNGK